MRCLFACGKTITPSCRSIFLCRHLHLRLSCLVNVQSFELQTGKYDWASLRIKGQGWTTYCRRSQLYQEPFICHLSRPLRIRPLPEIDVCSLIKQDKMGKTVTIPFLGKDFPRISKISFSQSGRRCRLAASGTSYIERLAVYAFMNIQDAMPSFRTSQTPASRSPSPPSLMPPQDALKRIRLCRSLVKEYKTLVSLC